MFLRDCIRDVGYSWRQFAAARVVTGVAVLTLAVGIGANAAIFSLLDTALLQTLPVHDPQSLRTVRVVMRSGIGISNIPSELFNELRKETQSFSGVFAFYRDETNFDTGGDIEQVPLQTVSGGYYSTLGVRSFLGRTIDDQDEKNRQRVAVLSYSFWAKRFGGDPAVIDKTIYISGVPTEVIGVTPPGFFGTDEGASPDITVPFDNPIELSDVWATVRLKAGVSDAQAEAEANVALQRALELMRPGLANYRASEREEILTQRAKLTRGERGLGYALDAYTTPLRTLMLLSGVVLLIACVNVANVLLARFTARTREIGVRLALGASRRRLVRQFLTESASLSVIAAVAGIMLAFWMQRALIVLLMDEEARQAIHFTLNAHVLAFSAAAAIVTLLLFGLVPALHATKVDVLPLLKSEASGTRVSRLSLAKGLIVVQVAASVLLLSGAGLLVRSFIKLTALHPGMPVENMLVMRIGLSPREHQQAYPTSVYQELVERVRGVPGVMAATLGADFAFSSGGWWRDVWVEGQPPENGQMAGFNVVGPGFFSTVGIPLVQGREFSPRDAVGAPKVVVINEAFAKQYFPEQNPIGRHFGDQGEKSTFKYEVIGVAADTRSMFLKKAAVPFFYQPLLQDELPAAGDVVLHVRARGNPSLMMERVRGEIRALNPHLPVRDVMTLAERLSLAQRPDRMMAILASFFGSLALLLTAMGIYGVIAYGVGRRTKEIGVRLALGATPANVLGMIVRETLTLVGAGAILGLPLAFVCTRILKSMLFGVEPQDPITAVACIGVLLVAGLAAGYLPGRRAALREPVSALRTE
ncbi:MAG TPA: ABC transporter permease [Candidatus Acidoferrum sp.]|nr:ABC transporter permease [Candidatus Acidoferrum sp.]